MYLTSHMTSCMPNTVFHRWAHLQNTPTCETRAPKRGGSSTTLCCRSTCRRTRVIGLVLFRQVGSEAWRQQHDAVVSLSLQAHHNVATRSDEFVKEALVLHDKLRMLVLDILTQEVRLASVNCCIGCMCDWG